MKLLLPTLALFLLAPAPADEVTLHFAPEEGTVLKRVFVAEADYRLADLETTVDGEVIEREGELPDYGMRFTEHVAVTDTLAAVADGRPTELVRTFDELRQENVDRFEGEEVESALASGLEGRSVRFRWDADEERYDVEADDDEDLDDDAAGWLLEDLDLLLVLPAGEVEPGAEWELDPELYLAFMWPGGWLDFRAADEESDGEGSEEADDRGRTMSLQTIERLEGTGTARFEEVREEDGLRLAVIHVELEVTTGSDSVLPATDDGELPTPEVAIEVEVERKLTGTILWDLDHGHAHSAELECEASRLQTESFDAPTDPSGEGDTVAVEQSRLLEGTIRYTATITRE